MFLLKKLLVAWIFPPMGPVLLTLAGLFLLWRRRHRAGTFCILLGQGVLGVLALPVVSGFLLHSLERYPPLSEADLGRAQAIVILGGGIYRDAPEFGRDSLAGPALERVRYGARLAQQSQLPVLTTGGVVFGGEAEAKVMQRVLAEEYRVSVRWPEDRSRDTRENALYSAELLRRDGIQRIALVSSAWHLARAIPLFETQGLTVLPAPTVFTSVGQGIENWLPSASALNNSVTALREWLGRYLA
jgi:uncharacterized SAM-binding protein YcdF (DUF218 family)